MNDDIENSLKVWDFYPGAPLGKVGKPLKPGEVYFIDQYNQEYSRDIEPMQGGHGDNYYYQLMANIRKYKGIRKPAIPVSKTIELAKGFDQWDDSLATFYDHKGDVADRNSPGNFRAGPYVDTSGRNDVLEAKVTHDANYLYFYIRCALPLTSYKGENFMTIYINADPGKSRGWKGYDYVVNSIVLNAAKTTIKRLAKNGKARGKLTTPMKIEDDKIMIRVPRAKMKMQGSLNFEFHIADNAARIDNTFYAYGDHAPSRRANYSYKQ